MPATSEPASIHRMPDPGDVPRPWLSAYPPGVPPTYDYPPVALPRFLDDAARDFPDVAATWFHGTTVSYVELRSLANRFAGALAQLGVQPGDRVGVVLPTLPAAVVAFFGALRLGAVVVPVDPALTPAELARQLGGTDCVVVVTLPRLLERVSATRPALPALRAVVTARPEDWLPLSGRLGAALRRGVGAWRGRSEQDDVHDMMALIDDASPVDGVRTRPTDLALIQHTGGTTGVSRGVMLTHANLVANSFQARLWVPDIRAGHETLLCALPLSHIYGLVMGMLTGVLSAATLALVEHPDADDVLRALERSRATLFPAVPPLYRALVEHPEARSHDLSSVRAGVSGAAPLSPEVIARFEQLTDGGRVREGYGLSEASPLTHANPIYGRAEPGHIGLPVTDTVAVVVDPEDPAHVLEPGEPGELAVHGPQVMAGYWRDQEATAAVLRDGWLLTGDIVTCDADGVFTLVDRKKDVIFTGTRNVFPRDVEEALLAHPDVTDACVLGLPDGPDEDRVVAYVVLRPPGRASVTELAEHCRQRLAEYKRPDTIEIRESLPSSASGKMLRRQLRAEALGHPTVTREAG